MNRNTHDLGNYRFAIVTDPVAKQHLSKFTDEELQSFIERNYFDGIDSKTCVNLLGNVGHNFTQPDEPGNGPLPN